MNNSNPNNAVEKLARKNITVRSVPVASKIAILCFSPWHSKPVSWFLVPSSNGDMNASAV